jgi:deoxyadenosine/deoxycytidine kinase
MGKRMAREQTVSAQELEAQGWIRQFTVEAERADEYVELYEEMGHEVRVEPVTPDLMVSEECAACLLAACDKYVIIYTRPKEM